MHNLSDSASKDTLTIYENAIYYVITTLTTVGYGDSTSVNSEE